MSSSSDLRPLLSAAASRLQRAQSKFESLAENARRDIASRLRTEMSLRSRLATMGEYGAGGGMYHDALEKDAENALNTARLKTEKLLADDEAMDLMSILERYCDILMESRMERIDKLSGDSVEAIVGILATSSRIDSPELITLSQALALQYPNLTSDEAVKAHLATKLVKHVTPNRPSQTAVDETMVTIAKSYGVPDWEPPFLLPGDRRSKLIELLSATSSVPIVDKARLRHLCSHGIATPGTAWLRLRSWAILLDVLPVDKSTWTSVLQKGRSDYSSLLTQIERASEGYPLPGIESGSLSTQDKMLIQFGKDIEGLPEHLRERLEELESVEPAKGVDIRTESAIVDRLASLNALKGQRMKAKSDTSVPSITLDASVPSQEQSAILLSSEETRGYWKTILLRMVYVHGCLHASYAHPMGPSQALASIFAVVLILALQERQEASNDAYVDSESLDSLEAHVFWMVEAIIGSVRELVESSEDDGETWPTKFSMMVKWADAELWSDLHGKGLDPANPYYSYRWIPTLLTHALPLNVLLPLWDSIFSIVSNSALPPSSSSPQTLFLYVIGASMLIRVRGAIFHSGSAIASKEATGATTPNALTAFWRRQSKISKEIQIPHTPSAYSPVASPKTPSSPTMAAKAVAGWVSPHPSMPALAPYTPGGMGNVFLVTLRLLQEFDVDAFGGTERLLDTAWSVWKRWLREGGSLDAGVEGGSLVVSENQTESRSSGGVAASFGKLREMAWKGLTNDINDESNSPSPEPTPIEPLPHKPLPPPAVTITSPTTSEGQATGFFSSFIHSKVAENAWKGLTNQLDSPDPSPDISPVSSPMRTEYQRPDALHRVEPVPEPSPQREREDSVTSGGSTGGVAATSWVLGYAEKLRDSDTAASLSRTGTQLRAKAAGMWSRTPTPTPENQRSAAYAKHQSERSGGSVDLASGTLQSPSPIVLQERDYTSSSTSSIGSWSEMFSKRGSLPFVSSFIVGESRSGDGQGRPESVGMHSKQSRDSTGSTRLEDVSLYSPPPKPNTFRTQRDSMIGSVLYSAGLSSPESSFPQRSPSSGDLASKSPLQAALAALTGSPTSPGNASSPPTSSSGKRGPKPLLLSSSSLITPSGGNRSRSNSRTPSRGPSPSPTPTPRVSSHRFSSASTTTEEEHPVTGASGFVSLRRGPITNPRTAGYSTTAGTASATGSHSSRASTSSTSAYTRSTSLYDPPVVLQSSEEEGRMEHRSRNSGFIVDHGESSTAEYESAVSNPRSEDEEQEEDANEFGARIKQKAKLNRKPASIVVPPLSAGGVPDVQVITPRSGDKMDKGKGSSTVDEKDEMFVPPMGTGDARTPQLTRSRTPIRRARGASASSNVDERTPKGQKTRSSARDSMAVSGSEEEGARADVEDLDDLYGLY